MSARLAVLTAALLAALPVTAAQAAPPPNDTAAAAAAFTAVTAENGPVAEQQGLADFGEAGPDAGAPRCLGGSSFARTVWFRVPASSTPQLVRVEASGASGGTANVPDLAAYVQPGGAGAPLTAEPQACDGSAAGGAATSPDQASAVELRVPAGRDVLIQAGRSGASTERAVLILRTEALEAVAAPAGDAAGDAPALTSARSSSVPVGGATLTQEDPAQPRCAAAGSVWRRVVATRTGRLEASVTGTAVGTLTAFLGASPTGQNARVCANRRARGGRLSVTLIAKRGDTVWVRLGVDGVAKGQSATLRVGAPAPQPRFGLTLLGSRTAARLTRPRARVTVRGAAVSRLTVRLQRRVGKRFVTVAVGRATRAIAAGRTVTITLQRSARLRRGSYRLRVEATTPLRPRTPVRASGRTLRLR